MSLLLHALLVLMPWRLRRWMLVRWMGCEIAPTARIGLSLVRVGRLRMAEGARIGHLTVVRGLSRLDMGCNSVIGNLNWITGFALGHPSHFVDQPARDPALTIGEESAITNRHLIDCTDRVSIGRFSTFAGFRSQVLSHSINLDQSRQQAKPVSIGDHCFVGTACVLLPGAALPDASVLAAGSVLTKAMKVPGQLYAGVPAKPIKPIDAASKYLHRAHGFVD